MVSLCAAASAATYKNPVMTMDFSDPDVCVGGDGRFYMTASSFGAVPGLPVLVSDDLVNWRYVGYALAKHPFYTRGPEHGNCVWAPSIRYRADKGEYVIYWGDPDRGAYRVSAKDPAGPWSEPRLVVEGDGIIDTCPLYDDDGRIYLVNAWANSRAGMNSILTVRELNADETEVISPPVMVYDGIPDGNFTCEGPKFYKRNGEYWLFFPAGGVPDGWQVAARALSPFGPYEVRTVMAQGNTKINGPHQGGFVQDCAGRNWFLHFSDRDAYGRITYLQPMEWRDDGWPVIGRDDDGDGCGEPVEEFEMPAARNAAAGSCKPQTDDEFDSLRPGLQWQWLGKGDNFAGFCTPSGFYRQYSTRYGRQEKTNFNGKDLTGNTWDCPGLMVQKFPAFEFTATMKAQVGAKDAGAQAGLVVQGLDYARIGLRSAGDRKFEVVYTECFGADKWKNSEKSVVIATVPAVVVAAGQRSAQLKDVWFRVEIRQGETPPKGLCPAAMCTFYYSFDGENWEAANAKTPFKAREGKWIGATVGIFSLHGLDCKDRGWIDVDWFRIKL